VRTLEVDGSTLRAERVRDGGYSEVTATLPAVVSVTEKINEPRYPGFKGIMAAKKKPVVTLGIEDLGLDATTTGLANASTVVVDGAPRPPRESGEKVTDDGDGGTRAAEFLVAARLI